MATQLWFVGECNSPLPVSINLIIYSFNMFVNSKLSHNWLNIIIYNIQQVS